jgi:hypothetical protein
MQAMQIPNTQPVSRRHPWRRVSLAALVVASLALWGCGKRIPGPAARTITLDVTNRGYFDVNVYVMRSGGTNPIRLGMVTGSFSQIFRVKETDLQANGVMVVHVRTIAGRTSWTSPPLSVNIGTVARLEIYTTSTGDLSQSRFYTQ